MQVIKWAFLMISVIFIIVPRASVSIKRISEVLDTKLSILDPENPKRPKGKTKGLMSLRMLHLNIQMDTCSKGFLLLNREKLLQ